MDKWDYINLFRSHPKNDKYGRMLIELMDMCHKNNLQEVTLRDCKQYYEFICIRTDWDKKYYYD